MSNSKFGILFLYMNNGLHNTWQKYTVHKYQITKILVVT